MTVTPHRWSRAQAAGHVAVPGPDSDKYRRGVLAVRTGSAAYPGAAVLGVEAAWRTGVGMVRYAVPPEGDAAPPGVPSPASAVLAARPETVFAELHEALRSRSDAWLVGSGIDPARLGFAEREALRGILSGTAPVVIDAGALGEASAPEVRAARSAMDRPAPLALTPHRGEFLALWESAGLGDLPDGWERDRGTPPSESALAEATLALASRLGATVLLKGSLSITATPGGFCAVTGPATSWLATAGTGDVLAGILGALAATHADALRADPELFGPLGASAAVLHDAAARSASRDERAPIAALDVARALPAAIAAG